MKPIRQNILIAPILAALVISGAAFYSGCGSSQNVRFTEDLVVRDAYSGKVYGAWPLEASAEGPGEFALEFVHSVNQSPVREIFQAEDKTIKLKAMRFYSFGAGMPRDLEEGQTLSRDGDAMLITGYRASFKELSIIVGTISDHLLFINGRVESLWEICGKNTHIKIRCE